jgi:hypothetical protein
MRVVNLTESKHTHDKTKRKEGKNKLQSETFHFLKVKTKWEMFGEERRDAHFLA